MEQLLHQFMPDRRLQALLEANPDLTDAAALQEAVLSSVDLHAAPIRPIILPARRASDKLNRGTPLLHGEDVYLDEGFIRDVFGRLLGLLESRPGIGRLAAEIAEAADAHRLHPEHVVVEGFVNHPDHLQQVAADAGVDHELLATLADLSARPILAAYAEQLAPALERGPWGRGYCPICGAWPSLAELRGAEPDRHLRCSRCGCAWAVPRLFCPFCGNDDGDSLGHLQVEGERRFRVDVCRRCNGYLKAGTVPAPTPSRLLALDDLASAHLDLAAKERGHTRPAEPGFRLDLAGTEDDFHDDD